MAKVARTKIKDKWKSKVWYRMHAPSMFNYSIIAHTPADNPEFVSGRVAEVPVEKLTGDYSQKNFMIKFRVNEVWGNNAFTSFDGHRLTSDYKRALTRRRNSRIDCNLVLKLEDGVQIRIKPIILVDKRVKKSQEKALRAIANRTIEKSLTKLTLSEALKKIYSGDLSKDTAAVLKSTYPTKRVEISKINVLNPANLMEIPPDEDELEKILSSDEKEEIEEVPVEDEKNDDLSAESDDKIDFSTLKVAELKDLLKEKNLPVSGTKAELIERLKT
ncbi:MAG: 30S ribosomal protein S3ae [Candidatus Thermoplasmatota archaeon]|nr:30S ribosomal protein S3ae [Candidatus Thermoplasmatota archaeon]